MKRPSITREQGEEIAAHRERGRSVEWIARRLGLGRGAVAWHCLIQGIEKPGAKPLPPVPVEPKVAVRAGHTVRRFTREEDQRLLQLEAQGMKLSKIARALGRQRNSILGRLATLARHDERGVVA